MKRAIAIVVSAAMLAGCAEMGPKEQTGTAMGVATGAVLGAVLSGGRRGPSGTAVALGALAGGIAGSALGRSMDAKDRQAMGYAQYQALEYGRSGTPSYWSNPDSGHNGYVMPQQTYQRNDGGYCREYTQSVTIGGRTQQAYGTACRQPDGTWQVVGG